MSERKQQIIQLAMNKTMSVGFDSFSYNDLSQELGITNAAIHYHFPNKEALGLAITQHISVGMQHMFAELKASEQSHWEKIETFFQRGPRMLDQRLICPLISLLAEVDILPESIQQQVKQLGDMETRLMAELLNSGLQAGEFQFQGQPHDLAVVFLTAIKGALIYARATGAETMESCARQLRVILGGNPNEVAAL